MHVGPPYRYPIHTICSIRCGQNVIPCCPTQLDSTAKVSIAAAWVGDSPTPAAARLSVTETLQEVRVRACLDSTETPNTSFFFFSSFPFPRGDSPQCRSLAQKANHLKLIGVHQIKGKVRPNGKSSENEEGSSRTTGCFRRDVAPNSTWEVYLHTRHLCRQTPATTSFFFGHVSFSFFPFFSSVNVETTSCGLFLQSFFSPLFTIVQCTRIAGNSREKRVRSVPVPVK